jgi:hypothetical protein
MNYLISVIIPVVKTEFLHQTLEQFKLGNLNNLELIIINNGTKSYKSEIRKISQQFVEFENFKYLENNIQKPIIENWNHCIDNCSARFCLILSDDDIISYKSLCEIIKNLKQKSEYDLFYINTTTIDQNSKIIKNYIFEENHKDLRSQLFQDLVLLKLKCYLSSFVVRTSIIKSNRFEYLDSAWGSDHLLYAKCILVANKIKILDPDKIRLQYRYSNINLTSSLSLARRIKATITFSFKLFKSLLKPSTISNLKYTPLIIKGIYTRIYSLIIISKKNV